MDTGPIIITENDDPPPHQKVAIYARVSSHEIGFNYIETLLKQQGRRIEGVNLTDNGQEDL